MCAFHREQAWDRWMKTSYNKCTTRKGEILQFLRRIAYSATEDDLKINLQALHASEFWQGGRFEKFRKYFESTWAKPDILKVSLCHVMLLGWCVFIAFYVVKIVTYPYLSQPSFEQQLTHVLFISIYSLYLYIIRYT